LYGGERGALQRCGVHRAHLGHRILPNCAHRFISAAPRFSAAPRCDFESGSTPKTQSFIC
jgi:hypothetical protein